MRLLSLVAVACAVVLSTTTGVSAAPGTVISERWASGWTLGDGRAQDEPLDFDVHLAGPTSKAGLNATDPNELFASRSGYVYTGKYTNQPWAFTLKSPDGDYLSFTQGSDDLSFDVRNNSSTATFRILVKDSTGGYFVSDEEFTSTSTSLFNTVNCDFDALDWNSFVIGGTSDAWSATGWSMGSTATPNLSSITEVGFAALVNPTAAMRIDNIVAKAVVIAPEPAHAVSLCLALLFGVVLLRRRNARV